jgi:hypothetical protein
VIVYSLAATDFAPAKFTAVAVYTAIAVRFADADADAGDIDSDLRFR